MPDKFSTMSAFLYSPKIGRTTYLCTRLMIYAKEIETASGVFWAKI